VAGSLAIMTDAAHLASDCISFIIGLVAISVGGRPPDERMSFGYKRFGKLLETLVTILMSVPQSPGLYTYYTPDLFQPSLRNFTTSLLTPHSTCLCHFAGNADFK